MGVRQIPYQKGTGKPQFAGSGLEASGGGGSYTLPVATSDILGGVKIGSRLSISSGGLLSADDQSTPIATTEIAGKVKVGNGLSITNDGVLSASGGGGSENVEYKTVTTLTPSADWQPLISNLVSCDNFNVLLKSKDSQGKDYCFCANYYQDGEYTYSWVRLREDHGLEIKFNLYASTNISFKIRLVNPVYSN